MALAHQHIKWGAATPIIPGGDPREAIELLEQRLDRRLDIVNQFRKWGGDSGDFTKARNGITQAAASGRIPMISWEPMTWDSKVGPYSRESIIAGDHDAYIREWAVGLKSLGFEIYLRPMHEANGDWYHWCGNPALYREAWRHMRRIFRAEGVENVKWVWCVNVSDQPKGNYMESYWVGDHNADFIAWDGYNAYGGWRPWQQIMAGCYKRLNALNSALPMLVCETASPEADVTISGAVAPDGSLYTKADWIRGMFAADGFTRVGALVWMNEANPRSYDWRIATSADALDTMRNELADCAGYMPPPAHYVPPTPDRVEAKLLTDGTVNVSWRVAPSFTRGYKISRMTPDGRITEVSSRDKPYTSVTVPSHIPGSQYAVQTWTMLCRSTFSLWVTPIPVPSTARR